MTCPEEGVMKGVPPVIRGFFKGVVGADIFPPDCFSELAGVTFGLLSILSITI